MWVASATCCVVHKRHIDVVPGSCSRTDTFYYPQEFNSWDKTNPLDLFDARTVRLESNPKVSVPISCSMPLEEE